MNEITKRPFQGSVLQLGRQDTYFSTEELLQQAAQNDVKIREDIPPTYRTNPSHPDKKCIDDICFFKMLGFDTVHSMDACSFEDATYVWDLNLPVPESLHGKYDLIFDGGTMEHIFNIPVVLRNIHSMLKIGGKIVHYSPVHNFVDHGFYMFSPTFFHDYYRTNRYTIETSTLVSRRAPINNFEESTYCTYAPGDLDTYSVGGFTKENFDDEIFGMFFSAIRTEESTWGINPQQGLYKKIWAAASAS